MKPVFFGAALGAALLALTTAWAADPGAAGDTPKGRAASAAVQQAEPAVAPPAASTRAERKAPSKGAVGPAGTTGKAMDRLELDTSQITGIRELPKVMVIVPWKRSDIGDLVGRPVNSLVDEALQPVDREVFRREVDYYNALAPDRPRAETRVTSGTPGTQPEK